MSDINWSLAVNRTNPFGEFADGLQRGADMRRQTERDNIFKERHAFEMEQANRQRQQEEALAARKAEVGGAVAKGDFGAARQAAGGDFDMLESIGKLDEAQRKAARENAEDVGGFAAGLMQAPPEQRKAIIAQARPILKEKGFSDEQIDGFDPSDANLQALVTSSMGLKTALEEANRKRDDKRAEMTAEEARRHQREMEAQGRSRIGLASDANRRGWASFNERKKAGGFGTPGVGGVIADDDVEIDP
jgi:hypothetical protein